MQFSTMTPVTVSQLDLVFPARGGELTPEREDIPAEFWAGNEWTELAHRLFLCAANELALIPREGIDPDQAWRHLRVVLGTYDTQYEHKIAGLAYLLYSWFEGVRYTYRGEQVEVGEGH